MIKTCFSLLCFFMWSCSVFAQHYENLAFEGAGIRGIAYAGVIESLESNGELKHIKNVSGTSAGAITATLLVLGYNAREIEAIIGNTNFGKFNDGGWFFAGGIYRTMKQFGWYKGKRFEQWISKLIEAKTGNPDITFAELSAISDKNLYITAVSLNRQKLLVFCKEDYPNMKVKDAVRASMSIPLYFKAVFLDKEGKVYKKANSAKDLDIVVDGGLLANFPIHIFPNSNGDSTLTLGVRIDSENQILQDAKGGCLADFPIRKFRDFVSAFYVLTIEHLNRQQLSAENWKHTISVSDANIPPRVRKLSESQKSLLIENGKKACEKHFKSNGE